jgi:hypothetical protein
VRKEKESNRKENDHKKRNPTGTRMCIRERNQTRKRMIIRKGISQVRESAHRQRMSINGRSPTSKGMSLWAGIC